ncbi:MAG: A/G-specific adenine glycosylase [Flavobacteriales bacterium]
MIKKHFLHDLHNWYTTNKRDLPFRNTTDPYLIWLSEIILQQTRVNQGLPYYQKFVTLFPTVNDLANAEEQDVLNAWQGLGYYSRARNLHFSAKYVVENLNSVFPTKYNELIKLKGVGDYTASAIASFSSKEIVPVLDGNVYRFMSRMYGIETPINTPKAIKEFKFVLNELIDHKKPDLFNQAIIEFGALHCTPKAPNCHECPFNDFCFAYANKEIDSFPVKLKKKKSVERFLNFYLIRDNNHFFITKREEDAIWKNLYEFPNLESKDCFDTERIPKELNDIVGMNAVVGPIKHILSHQNIHAKLFICNLKNERKIGANWMKIAEADIADYPIHRLMEKMLEKFEG